MARDYLAIQGSSVPSERAFSSGGLTGTSRRNRLNSDTFEALQLLKSAYKNNHIGAAEEAEGHIRSYLAALAVLEGEDAEKDRLDSEDGL
jgi:hAT family C-terminal dimerisation region